MRGESRRITAEDVEAIVSDAAPSNLDEVVDQALLGDLKAVETALTRFFHEGGDAGYSDDPARSANAALAPAPARNGSGPPVRRRLPGAVRQIAAARPSRAGEAGRTLDLGVDRPASARGSPGERAGSRRLAAGRGAGDAGAMGARLDGGGGRSDGRPRSQLSWPEACPGPSRLAIAAPRASPCNRRQRGR